MFGMKAKINGDRKLIIGFFVNSRIVRHKTPDVRLVQKALRNVVA